MFINNWYAACAADAVGEDPLRVRILAHNFVLFRNADGVHCLSDYCCHRGASLAQGTCKDGTISVTFDKATSHNQALRFVSGAFTGASSTLPEYEHFGQWRIKVEELKSLAPYSFAKVEADGRKYISMRGSWITEKAQ